MPTKNYLVTFLLFYLTSLIHSQGPVKNLIDCDNLSISLSTTTPEKYNAEDFYLLGVCEYQNSDYHSAYNYFTNAKALGYTDEEKLDTFINNCQNQLIKLENQTKNDIVIDEGNEIAINNYKHKVQVYLLNFIFISIAFIGLFTAFNLIYKNRTIVNNVYLGIFLLQLH